MPLPRAMQAFVALQTTSARLRFSRRSPINEDANELIEMYDACVEEKIATGARVGRLLMILLGALIVALAIVPPVVEKIIELTEREDLSYYKMAEETYYVDCDNYEIKSAVIRPRFNDKKVTVIGRRHLTAVTDCAELRSPQRSIRSVNTHSAITRILRRSFSTERLMSGQVL